MFEITFTINGHETQRMVRLPTQEQAEAVIAEEFPESCIVRVRCLSVAEYDAEMQDAWDATFGYTK